MLISVIVSIYNREAEIRKCIESIIGQTYKELEIILVDDGSTDSSLQICREYEQRDRRIRIIHKENGGLISARVAGVKVASGDYIGHIDGDDWIESTYFEALADSASREGTDMVIDGFVVDRGCSSERVTHRIGCGVYDRERIENEIYPKLFDAAGDGYRFIYHSQWAKLSKKELAKKNQLMVIDDRNNGQEDAICIYPMILEAKSICVIDKCLYHYVIRENSINEKGTDNITYFQYVKSTYNQLRERICSFYKNDQILLNLERYISLDIINGFNKFLPVKCEGYLFPYELIEKGEKVILYGAGSVGCSFYKQLMRNHYCDVMLWVDQNNEHIDVKYAKIYSPDKISTAEDFDHVVICVDNENIADEIKITLRKMNIPIEKFVWKAGYRAELEFEFKV